MTTCFGKSCSLVFRERLSIFVCASFPVGFESGMWDLIVLILIIAFLFTSEGSSQNPQ